MVVVWILARFAWSLPHQLDTFQHPSARSAELAPAAIAALRQVGVSVGVYAWVAVIFGSAVMLVAMALALILFWRRGDDWMALLVALLFPAYCLDSIGPSETFTAAPSGSPLEIGNSILLSAVTFGIIYAVFMLFPTTFFIAILRHRLYEIDLIIRRTLVFGTLTAILAGVYFAIVLGAQLVARRLTGAIGQQPVIIVATTLLIAALVSPLRRYLQAGIDRAFYRSKYDTRLKLERFASQLRMETDLEELNGRLVDIVQQTMRPTHATLWLCTPSARTMGTSTGERPPPR